MRRRTIYAIVSFAFISWLVIVCYLFVHKPLELETRHKRYKEVNNEIERLEHDLKEQLKSNEELLFNLRSLKKQITQTGESIETILTRDQKDEVGFFAPKTGSRRFTSKTFSNSSSNLDYNPIIPILVMACNRVTVSAAIKQLLKYRPENLASNFPIIVSQDCGHVATKKVILGFGDKIKLIEQPDLSDYDLKGKEKKFKGYYKISRHYLWALNHTFNVLKYDTIIIVEDDLLVAPDFFEYFFATHSILQNDPTLWCVSAWNDNGKEAIVNPKEPDLLYRSDFFPGLGWMLTKDTWSELAIKWPKAFWDDWIRQPDQRKDRSCIRPEISRTKTFGKIGVSNGLFFEKHLKYIKLNEQFVPFTKMDLSYLLKDNYDISFINKVYNSPVVTINNLVSNNVAQNITLRVTYRNKDHYKKTAKQLGLMDDFKSGVPRTGYRGIVSLMYKRKRVFLAPPPDWKGYDTSWS